MCGIAAELEAKTIIKWTSAVGALIVVGVVTVSVAAEDRSTLKIPDGLAFSNFYGYENWQDVSVSQTEIGIKVIVANPVMMKAFKSGLPAAGKTFPDGSKVAKEWSFKRNTESPYFVNVPDNLKNISFIEKDTKWFPNTHGWVGPRGAECGYECHSKVSAQDYIYTAHPKR
jgi:hypothetical protein